VNLHPVTWVIFGLAIVGLWFVLSLAIPMLIIGTLFLIWQRSKPVNLKSFTQFEEINDDRIRSNPIRRRSSHSRQDA